jgi:hypothetical protein
MKKQAVAKHSHAAPRDPSDPIILGVSLPVYATKHAAADIALAWLEAATAVVAAVQRRVPPFQEVAFAS